MRALRADRSVKIVIIGNPGVGKTSLRRAYLGEKFRANYIQTIGSDFSFNRVEVNDESVGFMIWDLAGQTRFQNVHPDYYSGACGAIVVYDLLDRTSFEDVRQWIRRFLDSARATGAPVMVIGNKMDLIDENADTHVSDEEHEKMIRELTEEYKNEFQILGSKTSAKTGSNVELCFSQLAQSVVDWIDTNLQTKKPHGSPKIKLEDAIPSAYLVTMNELTGPSIACSSPPAETDADMDFDEKTIGSAIKLVTALDFEDVIAHAHVLASFPWAEPVGTLYYVAFTLGNPNARGGTELHIVGVNVRRDLADQIAGLRGVVDGFLHNAKNEVAWQIANFGANYATGERDNDGARAATKPISQILLDLRTKTLEHLCAWYEIFP